MIPGSAPFDNNAVEDSSGSNQKPNNNLQDQGNAKKLETSNKFLVDNTIENEGIGNNNDNETHFLPYRQNIIASNYPQSLYPYNQLYPQFYQYQYAPQFSPVNQQFLKQQNPSRFNSQNMTQQFPPNTPQDPTTNTQFFSVSYNQSPNQGSFPSQGPQQQLVRQSANYYSRQIPPSISQQSQQDYPHPMVKLSMAFSEKTQHEKETGTFSMNANDNNIKHNSLQSRSIYSIPEQNTGCGTFSTTTTSRRGSANTEEEDQEGGEATTTIITENVVAKKNRKPKIVHSCEVCGKIFKRKQSLQTHMNVHFNLRPFRCFICGKTFNAKQNYMRHERSHLKRKPSSRDGKMFDDISGAFYSIVTRSRLVYNKAFKIYIKGNFTTEKIQI
ncbi:hypothetical protein HANVADRAFT_1772 [Hanseniaspora valbyensis NRRL Y-1626]|uniref:C2H2-type domain-containing protein n=1 Tax=Hanseniaspora valbyensis NRRL Y-1626 TaxID=766949 RepID=A0A1B7TFP7_9ASCO|nr:hypothetical protein HANVADRAFT_1772 [Hanseniaspora valbyensis NRRL Y-1626]